MSVFSIAVSTTLYVLQATSPMGGVQQLSEPLRSDRCYHAKQAQERAMPRNNPTHFTCVPVRVDAHISPNGIRQSQPYNYYGPRHPQYPVPQSLPYVPYDGRHNLHPSPDYRGAPLVDRSHQSSQRWYESWQNGRMGCVTPRECR